MQVVGGDFSAMLLDDSIRNAQPQTGSFARIFGGEEWIENSVRIWEAGAVVAEADSHAIFMLMSLYRDPSSFDSVQCVERIVEKVQKNLLEKIFIDKHAGK